MRASGCHASLIYRRDPDRTRHWPVEATAPVYIRSRAAEESTYMSMTFTEEQDEFRKSVRRFLEQKSPSADVRRLMETDEGYDPAVWRQMAEQLGLQGLALPEEYGGSGFGFIEQIAVL